jgi:dTDP-4-dehydrorhamnose 3,5-epimerase
VTDFYHPNDEGGLMWNDPDLGVEWLMPEGMTEADLNLSDKDKVNWSYKEYLEKKQG